MARNFGGLWLLLALILVGAQVHQAQGIWADLKAASASLTDHFLGYGKEEMHTSTSGDYEPPAAKKDFWANSEGITIETQKDLERVLNKAKENDLIVLEAYANWCGACKSYKKKFEKIANYFNTAYELDGDKRDPTLPRVWILRADCGGGSDALKKMCGKFSNVLGHFPALAYGEPARWRKQLAVPTGEELEKLVEDEHEKETLLLGPMDMKIQDNVPNAVKFIEQMAFELNEIDLEDLDEPLYLGYFTVSAEDKQEEMKAYKKSDGLKQTSKNTMNDIEISTGLSLKYLNTALNIRKEGAREAFVLWQNWIAHHHPSGHCMKGAHDILAAMDTLWPIGESSDKIEDNLMSVYQCGEDVLLEEGAFRHCTEYTCGLWMAFHAMSVSENGYESSQGIDPMSGADMMQALKGFIDKFFMCDVCRTHFLQVLANPEVGISKQKTFEIKTQEDFALWLWEAHNVVNVRLAKEEEESGEGDPSRVKHVYPNGKECDMCYKSGERWTEENYDHQHILQYLNITYTNPRRFVPDRAGHTKATLAADLEREAEKVEQAKQEEERRRLRTQQKEREEAYRKHEESSKWSSILKMLLACLAIIVGCVGLLVYYSKELMQQKQYKQFSGHYA